MGTKPDKIAAAAMTSRFRARFWQPPRPHGEIIPDRTVSFLELFYDLVYVVLIARAAHTLAHHVSWGTVADFAAIFGLLWIAWLNGTIYHELHSRQDGRSRTFVFVQMVLLAALAVYTGGAAGADGAGFATVYSLLLLVLTWLWYVVRRQDSVEYHQLTARYISGMLVSVAVMVGSIALPDDDRVWAWGALVVTWAAFGIYQFGFRAEEDDRRFVITDSLVERFGLFTIIVLGEVVVGVVDGLSEAERNVTTIATGLIGLQIGFGFWWTYFDFVGGREPRHRSLSRTAWIYGHLPVSMAIAASGAAMVSLVEHARDDRAPAATVWLLTGSTAVMLLSLALTMRSLAVSDEEEAVYGPATTAVLIGAAAAIGLGVLRPSPLILVVCVVAIQSAVWWFAVDRWLRYGRSPGVFEG
jgi:low temperature requirement protein LtrA